MPEEPADLAPEPFPAVEPEPEPAPEPEPDVADFSLEPRLQPADELPRAFRERAQTEQRVRQAAATGAIWAGMLGVLVLLIGAAVIMRQDVARIWPRTAGAYAMVGLPVNLVGLAIEGQHAQPALKDGHAAVVVSGSLRNVWARPVAAPPLRISLLNNQGKAVLVKIADPGGARIPPGEVRRFSVDVLDPPVSATDVEIAFVVGRRPAAAAAPGARPARPDQHRAHRRRRRRPAGLAGRAPGPGAGGQLEPGHRHGGLDHSHGARGSRASISS
jgi:hypothetical protein